MTEPLPAVRDDPSIAEGRQVKAQYLDQVQEIRYDFRATDLDKAQRLRAAWEQTTQRLSDLYADFIGRRRARLEEIQAQMPFGPNIPANASPADTVVLQQAWRVGLDRARRAKGKERRDMLADAERFDDDMMRRALLTTYADEGRADIIDEWAENRGPDTASMVAEWRSLQGAVNGQGFDHLWVTQALAHPGRPPEIVNIPVLTAARDAQERALMQQQMVNRPQRRL